MDKVYRIYKREYYWDWSPICEDYISCDDDITIKYVDSEEKAKAFLQEREDYNRSCTHCYECPIVTLTKRKYDKRKSEFQDYCSMMKLYFNGNALFCENEKSMDLTDYGYEEIEVE